ncbi:ribokinase [Desertifilum sp. FACHB-1129]|uniref:Ribokinase n=1 Tax=Desertifilum tharense IPPAS B-1220 TaxID=1781255 RepID=A0A1E5QKD7_9CYAN|nr:MULTISPECIES: ribokinase [Desertifilum]MDA0211120.1 ribokinase [Cyanobacteria bacterium FC1]MBD2314144.1 ribokinase [Desertifilum sp. FACHB-1129]MBD2320109.1 ribokinase [Desertifilum sp. FACHB-866]MBD2330237.1 ribokinase [Desertifilum sp. FACHB-868]OEJ75130.1 ribokinase [Desertifilum tharense IPPAS B-1220]
MILVFGSINLDLVTQVQRLPQAGETLSGQAFFTVPGGKGANQAVAAARLGIPTQMVGRVGGDRFGAELLAGLQTAGVNTEGVEVDASTHSGVAVIAVDAQGENTITIVAGANGRLDNRDVLRLKSHLPQASALLLQLEIPLPVVVQAAQAAQAVRVPVILDPAPVPAQFPPELYPLVKILTPNEVEASQLVGFPVNSPETAAQAATLLRQRGVENVIIKLGRQGAYCATPQEAWMMPAFEVEVVDTVAAGDAFNGALAAALDLGLSLKEAIAWGIANGSLSTTQAGAQSSLPDRYSLKEFLLAQGISSGVDSLS